MNKYFERTIMHGLTALVTGGGSGIGLATARLLLDQGAQVMIIGRDREKLIAAAATLANEERLKWVTGDVSSEGYANKIVKDTIKAFGGINILINNAGVFRSGSLFEMPEEDFDYNIDGNLKSTWFMCKFAAREMCETGGAIVNVASLLAKQGLPGTPSSAYSASKGGILSLTRALAVELAPYKIRVNAVVPAVVRTPMLDAVVGNQMERVIEKSKKVYPAGRVGEPEDVARAVMFLADPTNSWITGTEMIVDGGISVC